MYKTILILGAETSFGIRLTDYLLSQKYFVTIFIKNKSINRVKHFNLEVIEGDVFDFESLRYAIAGQQVILNVLDYRNYKLGAISVISQNIVHAVNINYVDKYIGLVPFGSGQTKNRLSIFYQLLNYCKFIQPILDEYSFQESLLSKSKFDYTIVQVGKIINEASDTTSFRIVKLNELDKTLNKRNFSISETALSAVLHTIIKVSSYSKISVVVTNKV
jgi:putative NADH-flavin reductase